MCGNLYFPILYKSLPTFLKPNSGYINPFTYLIFHPEKYSIKPQVTTSHLSDTTLCFRARFNEQCYTYSDHNSAARYG